MSICKIWELTCIPNEKQLVPPPKMIIFSSWKMDECWTMGADRISLLWKFCNTTKLVKSTMVKIKSISAKTTPPTWYNLFCLTWEVWANLWGKLATFLTIISLSKRIKSWLVKQPWKSFRPPLMTIFSPLKAHEWLKRPKGKLPSNFQPAKIKRNKTDEMTGSGPRLGQDRDCVKTKTGSRPRLGQDRGWVKTETGVNARLGQDREMHLTAFWRLLTTFV